MNKRFYTLDAFKRVATPADKDEPFYVFGRLVVRGGDLYFGSSHKRKCDMLEKNGIARRLVVGRSLLGE